ncbi:TetR/AcrR family transcriptional regulator [Streptomyces sp. NPDC096311]|uniref:TetR/AcrR family transcriptional regulator n=1 Tax=Streptomyces sp. NPDC096311 TaxID=3366083 RepID=UPI00382A5F75
MAGTKQFDPDVAVERAMEVFWLKGYAATTPQNLVDALGIGKGSLYNAFGSKHGLFEQALSHYCDRRLDRFLELLDESAPVRERLRGVLEFIVDEGARGCMVVNTVGELAGVDEAAVTLVRRDFDRVEAVFRALIEEGQRSGEIVPDRDPAVIGSMLLNAMMGLWVLVRVPGERDRLDRVIAATIDAL